MVNTPRPARRGALLLGTAAVLGLLTSCGNGTDVHSDPPVTASGPAAPARESTRSPASPAASSATAATAPSRTTGSPGGGRTGAPPVTVTAAPRTTAPTATGKRCHTGELRAAVGRVDPGAGQENFPVVLTNTSARTCTLHGYPGAAFVSGSGAQLGPDPTRAPGSAATVTLRPGQSAWAGLTFSNPAISEARTATPAALLVTPPDEHDPLRATWRGGPVPVSGNSSSVRLTVLSPGTGP